MKKIIIPLIFAVLFSSACNRRTTSAIEKSTSTSSETTYKDSLISALFESNQVSFNLFQYCDSLYNIRKRDTLIKYIPMYIESVKSTSTIKLQTTPKGQLIVTKPQDTVKSLIKIPETVINKTDSVKITLYAKNYCDIPIHQFYKYATWILGGAILLYIVIKNIHIV